MRQCAKSKTDVLGIILLLIFLIYVFKIFTNEKKEEVVNVEARLSTFMENIRRKGLKVILNFSIYVCLKDEEKVSDFLSLDLGGGNINETQAKILLYQTLAFPLQGVCR